MLVKLFLINVLRTNINSFVKTNFTELSKKFNITQKPNAEIALHSVLGALGLRFKSCSPYTKNPSQRIIYQPVFFAFKLKLCGLANI